MAVISKGITLSYGETALTNLMEIPELGGDAEAIEITTLADAAHMYTEGIKNYGDGIAFKFLYEETQFMQLNGLEEAQTWKVTLPGDGGDSGIQCTFGGTCSVKLDSVGVNAALTYTLTIKPNTAMVWG